MTTTGTTAGTTTGGHLMAPLRDDRYLDAQSAQSAQSALFAEALGDAAVLAHWLEHTRF